MSQTGKASGNAVLAKARALYGRRLRADDYRRLMGCRTMPSWKACCARACTPAMTAFAAMTAAQAARCMSISPSAVRWTS